MYEPVRDAQGKPTPFVPATLRPADSMAPPDSLVVNVAPRDTGHDPHQEALADIARVSSR
jgi:hypothetical protein